MYVVQHGFVPSVLVSEVKENPNPNPKSSQLLEPFFDF